MASIQAVPSKCLLNFGSKLRKQHDYSEYDFEESHHLKLYGIVHVFHSKGKQKTPNLAVSNLLVIGRPAQLSKIRLNLNKKLIRLKLS